MQTSQAKINQDVAVALERVIGRLENMEQWRREVDEERRDTDRRRETRSDQRFQVDRATIAIAVTVLLALIQLWPHLH